MNRGAAPGVSPPARLRPRLPRPPRGEVCPRCGARRRADRRIIRPGLLLHPETCAHGWHLAQAPGYVRTRP